MKVNLITPNKYTRSMEVLKRDNYVIFSELNEDGITTADEAREFLNTKAVKDGIFMGAHYLIDRNGDVVACVPEMEVAYANRCSWEGIIVRFVGREINDKMEQAAVELTEDICTRHEIYGIRRHYDFTGKQAPFVYAVKPSKFRELRERITGFTPEPVVYDESEDDEDDYYYE